MKNFYRLSNCYNSLYCIKQPLFAMKNSIFILLLLCFCNTQGNTQNTIYHLKIDSVAGIEKIDFSRFAGKKILIVNIATHSTDTSQLRELRQLQAQQPNLIVVAIPTNSFNNEP